MMLGKKATGEGVHFDYVKYEWNERYRNPLAFSRVFNAPDDTPNDVSIVNNLDEANVLIGARTRGTYPYMTVQVWRGRIYKVPPFALSASWIEDPSEGGNYDQNY